MADEGIVEIGGDGAREGIPAYVVGGNVGLDRPGKIVEGDRGTIDWIDVNNYHKIDWGIWICSRFELVISVDKLGNF